MAYEVSLGNKKHIYIFFKQSDFEVKQNVKFFFSTTNIIIILTDQLEEHEGVDGDGLDSSAIDMGM